MSESVSQWVSQILECRAAASQLKIGSNAKNLRKLEPQPEQSFLIKKTKCKVESPFKYAACLSEMISLSMQSLVNYTHFGKCWQYWNKSIITFILFWRISFLNGRNDYQLTCHILSPISLWTWLLQLTCILACWLACLLAYLLSYIPAYKGDQTVLY